MSKNDPKTTRLVKNLGDMMDSDSENGYVTRALPRLIMCAIFVQKY